MRTLWAFLFAPRPYGCGQCGKRFRNAEDQGKHIWKEALDPRGYE